MGLPHDNCPTRHWGYVVSGRMRVVYNDHEEICEAGDMFYWPPYHMPTFEEDTVLVEFSPRYTRRSLPERSAKPLPLPERSGHGQSYPEGDYRRWLAGAGFGDIAREDDIARHGSVVARKAG